MISITPIFCVVLKDGDRWQVEAEWPDGTVELVSTFGAGLDALEWVKKRSAEWTAERVYGAPAALRTVQRRTNL
jgi:hypothetical protein